MIFFRERADNDNCEDIDDDGVSNFCDCIHTVMNQFIYLIYTLTIVIYRFSKYRWKLEKIPLRILISVHRMENVPIYKKLKKSIQLLFHILI